MMTDIQAIAFMFICATAMGIGLFFGSYLATMTGYFLDRRRDRRAIEKFSRLTRSM